MVLAHDVGQSGADRGHDGRAGLGGRRRERPVERRAVVLGKIAVYPLHGVDALGGELLGQAFPVGRDHALALRTTHAVDPAPGLGG